MTTQPATPSATPAEAANPPQPSAWRVWLFRIAAMTLVPTLVLTLLEFGLWAGGYGYPTRFFIQRAEVISTKYYISNGDFGKRFFPPALARSPAPMKLAATKPAGTRRIFVLGESAAMGFPDESVSFSRILDVLLRDQYPQQQFEILNTAMVAISSHVIVPIARECAGLEPDLFIVFMGNNEVVGPFGAAGVVGPFTPSLPMIRANLAIKTTRTGQLLDDTARWWSQGQTPPAWDGMAMFQHARIRASDPQMAAIYDNHRQNLRDICHAARSAGATVIVCTVPVNLKDSPPFASLHAADLSEEGLAKWDRIYNVGNRLEADQKWSDAIARYEEAGRIDGGFADLQYRWARCLLAQGKPTQALAKFRMARDLDALRFRTDEAINAAIREVAKAEEVNLVDAEDEFARSSPGSIPGDELFHEHVHLTFSGNYLLARSVATKIVSAPNEAPPQKRPFLSEEDCARRLAFTNWNRVRIMEKIASLMQKPPFTEQLGNAERAKELQRKIDKMRGELKGDALKSAAQIYERAIPDRADDWMLMTNFGDLLMEMGDLPGARKKYEAVAFNEPYVFHARAQAAQLTAMTGDFARAKVMYHEVIKLAPDYPDPQYGLAETLAAEGRFEDALKIFQNRVQRDPAPGPALERMAEFLIRQKRPDQAQAALEEALKLTPNSATAHATLGDLFHAQGKIASAREHYTAALVLRPGWTAIQERLAEKKK